MEFDGHSWHVEPVSQSEFQRLTDSAAEYPQPNVENLVHVTKPARGGWGKWPCPFCSPRRLCPFLGTVPVDENGVPAPWDHTLASVRDLYIGARFFADLRGGLREWLMKLALPSDERGARVYTCPVHDIFYIPYHGRVVDPFETYVSHDGEVHKRPGRFSYCLGFNETLSRSGQTISIEWCARLLEWHGEGEEIGLGEGGYTCHIHGEQTYLTEENPSGPFLVARRFVD